ncbi:MAG: hypothetical protein AB1705_15500 [Verrucomicrobiota bacterium]
MNPTPAPPHANGGQCAGRDWFGLPMFAGVVALILFAAFPDVWLGSRSFFYRDYGVLGYPAMHHLRESLLNAELPLWNPYSNCGAPFLAQWGTMALYPGSLLLLLPMPWSLGAFCLVHLWLGALGMWRLAHRFTGDTFAASVAGVAFGFGGVTLSSLMWPNYMVALGWMPWVVLFVEAAWKHGGKKLAWAVCVASLQMLSGVPEIVLLTWFVLSLMLVGQLVIESAGRVTRVRRFAVGILLVAGICAAQLLPFFELLAHSHRDAGFATAKWAMPAWGWANLIVPMFHYFMTPQGTVFQAGQQFMTSYYLGAGALLLAMLGAWRAKRKSAWLFAGIAMFGLLMALGERGHLYSALKALLPALGLGRYPIKFVYLAALAAPLLAAFGVQRLRAADSGADTARRGIMIIGAALVVLMGVLLWAMRANPLPYDRWAETSSNTIARGVLLVLLCGLVMAWRKATARLATGLSFGVLALLAVDGLTHLPNLNPTIPSDAFAPGLVREHWKLSPPPELGQARVMISPAAEQELLQSSVPQFREELLGRRLAFWSNLNLLDAVPKVNGSSTLQIREQKQVQDLLYATPETDLPRLEDFLGVAHETPPKEVVKWARRDTTLPWMTAGQKPAFADGAETLGALTNAAFEPANVVYLPLDVKDAVRNIDAASAKLTGVQFGVHEIKATLQTDAPCVVVIAQSFYPAWAAYVNGQRVPLWRANHAFQALAAPAGNSEIVVRYEDRQFRTGMILSALTLAGLAVWQWRLWLRGVLGKTGART